MASLGPRGSGFLSTRQNRRREPLGRPTRQQSRRDPDVTGVDTATVSEGAGRANRRERGGGLDGAEQKKQRGEWRCDRCRRQGHMRQSCPKTNEGGGSNGNGGWREERARVTAVEGRRGVAVSREADGQATATRLRPLQPTTPRPS